ncbi:unnamed protein product [Tilletia controversa]|nr:unnamed protein product [Tilletia controversa]
MRPKWKLQTSEPPDLGPLTDESLAALRSLAKYRPDPEPCPNDVPAFRRAAVLLGLFGGRHGDLYVVLSKRAAQLRSHSGDTAIPGGRFEPQDHDLEETAPSLNPNEVDALFSLPFKAFLNHNPSQALRAQLKLPVVPSPKDLDDMPRNEVSGPSDWHTCRDILWLGGHRVRRHTFWDARNPVRGLTSDILIHAASIAYKTQPDFSLNAPGQLSQAELIKLAFLGPMAVKKRRVRPRMTMLPQPKDDDDGDHKGTENGRSGSESGAKKEGDLPKSRL